MLYSVKRVFLSLSLLSMQPTMPVVTKSKVSVTLAIVVGVILAASITAWGFLNYSKSGEAYILESLLKMSTATTLSYENTIEASADIESDQPLLAALSSGIANTSPNQLETYSVNVSLTGHTDLSDEKNPASSINIGLVAKKGTEPKADFQLNLVNKDKVYYARIPKLPAGDISKDYANFENTWIHFDYSELSKELMAFQESVETSEKDAQKIIESIKQTMAQNPPIRVTKKYRTETIDNVTVRHFAFTLDPKNIETIITELAKNEAQTGVQTRDIDSIKKSLEKISSFNGEIWFGKKTLYPHKITLNIALKDTPTIKNAKVLAVLNMKNFNQPLRIEAPQGSKSFEEIINALMEQKMAEYQNLENDSVFSNFPANEQDLNKDSDSDGLPDHIESLLGTNPLKKDTDGDGYDDRTEINTGHDPLK
jgi:hypothetical protein